MKISEVISLARTSCLQGLSLGENDETVVGYINLAMIELYKRFPLKIEEYVLELQTGVSIYTMPSNFMWISEVYGEVDKASESNVNRLPVNQEDNPLSVNTISWNKIQVPLSEDGAYISIMYVATPEVYTVNMLDEDIDLPPQMLEPLLAYVAYLANSTIDVGKQTEDSLYYIRFDNSCNKIEQRSMLNSDDMYMTDRVKDRGFV